MEYLILYIVKRLVKNPDEVKVEEGEMICSLELLFNVAKVLQVDPSALLSFRE